MTEKEDLERALRSQSGPREEGYRPMQLPPSLDEAHERRRSSLARTATLVPAGVAAFLVVAVVGAALSGWSPFGVGVTNVHIWTTDADRSSEKPLRERINRIVDEDLSPPPPDRCYIG